MGKHYQKTIKPSEKSEWRFIRLDLIECGEVTVLHDLNHGLS